MLIRAKTQLRLTNGRSNFDWTYPAGIDVKVVVKELLERVKREEGEDVVRTLFNTLLGDKNVL